MIDKNQIGKRGESIFSSKISKHFILTPSFLGDKYPAIDFIVDLTSVTNYKAFFFVSVKTTEKADYTKKTKRLKIKIGKDELKRLKTFSVPTYIVGIDEKKEMAFIVCVDGIKNPSVASIPTTFSLNKKTNLQTLQKEVEDFWKNVAIKKKFTSKFLFK